MGSGSRAVKVGIVGHTGRLGTPLTSLLRSHPNVEVVYTEARREVFGSPKDAEMVFLALPEGASKDYLPRLTGKRIIDLSIDHRGDESWVYGLPEINDHEIKRAERVANPGCYATSVILGLHPLKHLIENVKIASTSGISGAGMQKRAEDNFLTYKEGRQHPHVLEIEKQMALKDVVFVPQRIDTADKGIISTIFADYHGLMNPVALYRAFVNHPNKPFIRMTDEVQTKTVIGTNFCEIKLVVMSERSIVVITALDNIMKGGASQAVQNFNLMFGFNETTGLG